MSFPSLNPEEEMLMSTLDASSFPIHGGKAIPIGWTSGRKPPRQPDTNQPRQQRPFDAETSESRIRAIDAAAICMASGCLGG
jgi:hypothetical protein